MLRPTNATLLTNLATDGTAVAKLIKITRLDTTVEGFTSWNESLTFDAVTYVPTSSVETTALRQSSGSFDDNIEIQGIIDSDLISAEEIIRGLYDGASIDIYITDLTYTDKIFSGYIGSITQESGKFTADVFSRSVLLKQRHYTTISAKCPYKRFGNAECNFNSGVLTSYRHTNTVVSIIDDSTFTVTDATRTAAYFENGIILFTSGSNNNLEREIKYCTKASNTITVYLKSPPPYTIAVSDTIRMEMGCNRTWSRCKELSLTPFPTSPVQSLRYGGFVYVPGNEKVMQQLRS